MRKYNYKRLSPVLTEHLHQCIYFYHLQPYVKDYMECRIEDVGIDEMIVFRVVWRCSSSCTFFNSAILSLLRQLPI